MKVDGHWSNVNWTIRNGENGPLNDWDWVLLNFKFHSPWSKIQKIPGFNLFICQSGRFWIVLVSSNGSFDREFCPDRTVRRTGRTANLFGFSNFYVRFRKYDTRWWFLMQELNITPCVLKRFSRIKNNADKIINCTIICSVILPLFPYVYRTWGQKASKNLISRCSMTFRVVKSLEMPFNACFVNI